MVMVKAFHRKVVFHALWYSYPIFLLEKLANIKYIKEVLGHFDSKTTERYIHVA
jgi:site-specific recombinase XerD